MIQKSVEKYDLVVALKEEHKNEILRRYPKMKGRVQVWNIDDPICLPRGSDKQVFREIERKGAVGSFLKIRRRDETTVLPSLNYWVGMNTKHLRTNSLQRISVLHLWPLTAITSVKNRKEG